MERAAGSWKADSLHQGKAEVGMSQRRSWKAELKLRQIPTEPLEQMGDGPWVTSQLVKHLQA